MPALLVAAVTSVAWLFPVQAPPAPPPEGSFVVDGPDVLDATAESDLNATIADWQAATGNEIGVAIIGTTAGRPIEEYSLELFNSWGIGQAGVDNGVAVVLALDDRAIRLEVGLGLERALSTERADALTDDVVPTLAGGDVAGAVRQLVDGVIVQVDRGQDAGLDRVPEPDLTPPSAAPRSNADDDSGSDVPIGALLPVVGIAALGIGAAAYGRRCPNCRSRLQRRGTGFGSGEIEETCPSCDFSRTVVERRRYRSFGGIGGSGRRFRSGTRRRSGGSSRSSRRSSFGGGRSRGRGSTKRW
ncbi:MAG: TPM domain-containing protein [Acidimicrobiales bacterium]